MPETETETPEPTVLLTGISGATYKVLADVAIEAVPDGNGSRITDRWRRSVLLTDGKEVSAGIDAFYVQQSPIECRRLGYQAKGYVILHTYLGNEQVAVPPSVLHTRASMIEFSGNPSRIYATAEEPMVRLYDKETLTGLSVRETAEEIDALLSETPDTDTNAEAKAQDLLRALTSASAAAASAHSAYLKAKAEFVAAAEALAAAAKAMEDLQL